MQIYVVVSCLVGPTDNEIPRLRQRRLSFELVALDFVVAVLGTMDHCFAVAIQVATLAQHDAPYNIECMNVAPSIYRQCISRLNYFACGTQISLF